VPASKATGHKYGTASKATLVAVKMKDRTLVEAYEIYNLVAQDIEGSICDGAALSVFYVELTL